MAKPLLADRDEVEVHSTADLRRWLKKNHKRDDGVWLVTYKKTAGRHYVAIGEVIDELLCFGWVDSMSRGKDDDRTMHWIAPRNPNSNWSAANKAKVADLESAGRMTDSGRALIAAAKANGCWTALDAVERLEIPIDLAAAFEANPGAADAWQGFTRSARRATLEWIVTAKRDDTRARRVAETAKKAADGRAVR